MACPAHQAVLSRPAGDRNQSVGGRRRAACLLCLLTDRSSRRSRSENLPRTGQTDETACARLLSTEHRLALRADARGMKAVQSSDAVTGRAVQSVLGIRSGDARNAAALPVRAVDREMP